MSESSNVETVTTPNVFNEHDGDDENEDDDDDDDVCEPPSTFSVDSTSSYDQKLNWYVLSS